MHEGAGGGDGRRGVLISKADEMSWGGPSQEENGEKCF